MNFVLQIVKKYVMQPPPISHCLHHCAVCVFHACILRSITLRLRRRVTDSSPVLGTHIHLIAVPLQDESVSGCLRCLLIKFNNYFSRETWLAFPLILLDVGWS